MATKKNSHGREFLPGKAIGQDLRRLVIQYIMESGGNTSTGEMPHGTYTNIASKLKINRQSVVNIWKRFLSEGSVTEKKRTSNGTPKLTEPDVRMIEFLKRESPSITAKELKNKLTRYSPVTGNVHETTIYRTLNKNLNFTFKRSIRPVGDRFSAYNMRYTQAFIDYCQTKQPHQIKFMDESGFKVTSANRQYGHSEKGKPCIEISKYHPGPNLTLNFLIGLDSVLYYNFVSGPSNTASYLNFWHEASLSQDKFGRPTFIPGDLVIVDNCAIHHNQAEDILGRFFAMRGVEYAFLPTYSPDLNPAENCFHKIKTVLKQERFSSLVEQNLKLAIIQCISDIEQSDLIGFYRHTGYLNV